MTKKKTKYRNISLKTGLADIIEQFIRANPQFSYTSIAQFVEDAARIRLEQLKVIGPETLPRLERINHDEDGVKILDRELREVVRVFFKRTGIVCGHCGTADCAHVQFALTDSDVQKNIRKKRKEGWNL